MSSYDIFSANELEFLLKALDSASQNAAKAMSQMVGMEVGVSLLSARFIGAERAGAVIGEADMAVVAVRMALYGGITGEAFFILPEQQYSLMVSEMKRHVFGTDASKAMPGTEGDSTVIEETGNIVAGVYLTRMYEIIGLNIYHGAPLSSIDMYLSLLDETIARQTEKSLSVLFIENRFTIKDINIKTYLLLVPSSGSVGLLLEAVKNAISKNA